MSLTSLALESVAARFAGLESIIGNTPLLAIDYKIRGRTRTIYAKCEQMNFTGSIKDRMALHILRQAYVEGRIHPGDTIVATGCKTGQHRIQGISDEVVPAILHLEQLEQVVDVSDGDSILMAQKLAGELGLAVGISSGANFLAAVKVQDSLGDDAVVATVFADDNKKYLSTDLLRDEPMKPHYLSPGITLEVFRALSRVCRACTAVRD